VRLSRMEGRVVEGEELDPYTIPRGCPHIGVLPSTLSLCYSYPPVT